MYLCQKCNYQSETEANFCPLCGCQLVKFEPVETVQPAEPVMAAEPVQYTEPVQPAQPVTYAYQPAPAPQPQYVAPVQGPSLAMKIVGMALSIAGLVFAFFAFIYTIPMLEYDEAFIMPFTFSFFCVPMSLIGLIFSNKNSNQGDTSAFSKVGKILGIIGLALIGFTFFLSLVAAA